MTKKIIMILGILTISAALFGQGRSSEGQAPAGSLTYDENAYPPNGWTFSMVEAAERAAAEDKRILINFTGSDWCVWCKKLEKEVFSTQEFLNYADDNLVMVFIDSPQAIDQTQELVQHNQILQQALGIQGFPTLLLLDSDLTPLLQTGYREGGPGTYIEHLESDRLELDDKVAQDFRTGFGQLLEDNLMPLGI